MNINNENEDISNIKKLYGEKIRLSASKLDKIASCNFAFFMQYGLGAKKRKVFDLDAMKMGTFIHYILENLVRDIRENGFFDDDVLKQKIDKLILKYVSENILDIGKKTAKFRYIFTKLCDSVFLISKNVISEMKSSDFFPIDFELEFGENADLSEISVKNEDKTIATISGKLDRVDGYIKNDKLYIRVVDYKSGKKAFDLSDIWHGLNLQMLIYLFAIEKNALVRYKQKLSENLNKIEASGVLYVPVRQPIVNAEKNISDEKLNDLISKELERSGLVCDNMAILQAMEKSDKPRFLPVSYNKDGEISAKSSVASYENFGKLSKFIDKKLKELTFELISGKTKENPYKKSKDETACTYCDYKNVCHFEKNYEKFRTLQKIDKEQFWMGACNNANEMD